MKKRFSNPTSVKAIGAAAAISSHNLNEIVKNTDFTKCSGSYDGRNVTSLFGANTVHRSHALTLIADVDGHITVYDTAEIGVLAAQMKLASGAQPVMKST